MLRLRQNEKERAFVLAAGMIQVQVANDFNVSRMAMTRLKTRLKDIGTTNDRPVEAGYVKRSYVKTGTSASFIILIDL